MQIRCHLARSHRALTLLELVVTFIILALLAAVALPTYQTATTNTALLRDEAALVDLATVAQSIAVQHGSSVPSPADYTAALTSASYNPSTSDIVTNPTSIINEPAPGTGTQIPATEPGQVSVNSGTTTVNANGQTIPIGGAAMLTVQNDCVMVSVTPSKTISFYFTYNPAAPIECDGASAINGPNQTPPVVPTNAPPAPATVSLTGALPTLTANWLPVPNVNSYVVTLLYNGTVIDTTTVLPNIISTPFTGLTEPTYTVEVSGVNAAGTGPPGIATWVAIPNAPTAVVATQVSGTNNVTVTWTPPAGGGTPVTYTVTTVQDPSNTCTYDVGSSPANTCIITGLTPGDTYTFTVTATNPAGTGPPSDPSNPVTITALPGAPAAPIATLISGTTTASISWSPPADTGSSAIIAYTVQSSPSGSGCVTTGATSCTVTGLTPGTPYIFEVAASNSTGYGPYSPYSAAITATTASDPPTAVTATAGDSQATVSWTAPVNTGGLPITGYTVIDNTNTYTCTTNGATTCLVTGLTDGDTYTFTVTAANASGAGGTTVQSVPSQPSNPVTPSGPPSAPINPVATVTVGSTNANVSWSPPATSGGGTALAYTVTDATGQSCSTNASSATPTSCVVPGLTFGDTYTFNVVATNSAGLTGPPATTNPVTPYTLPDPPTNVTAVPGNAQAVISWTPPVNNGGAAITYYTATATTGATNAGSCTYTVGNSPANKCTITGLTNGTTYTITVVGVNPAGTSAPGTTFTTPFTTPGAPTGVATTGPTYTTSNPTSPQATVTWNAPTSPAPGGTGGSPITDYLLEYSTNQTTWTTIDTGSTNTTFTFSPNSGAANFYVRIAAVNNGGVSPGGAGPYSTSDFVQWGVTGQQTANANYTCDPSDTLSGTTCTHQASGPATSGTIYSCPSGYTVNGTTCTKTTSQSAAAATSYSCPSGDTMSNYTCTGTVSQAATATTNPTSGYQCASGWITPDTQHAYCIRFTSDPTQISCLHNNSVNDALWLYYGQRYVCELYYPNSMAPRSPTNPPYVTTYTTTYSCPNGYHLSGQNCTYSGTTPAIPSTTYSCPSGYTLSGYTCTQTATTTGTAGSSGYSCPSGYTLSGSTCSETTTYTASNGSICNSGDSLSGSTCTHTVTQAASNSPTCNSGDSLSGTTCYNYYTYSYGGSPYVSSYSCNSGDSLSGSTCTNSVIVAYGGTEDIFYTCPNSNWYLNNPNAYNAHGCESFQHATSQLSCTNNGGTWLGGTGINCELFTANIENIQWICNGSDAGGGNSSTCFHNNVTTYAATPAYSYSCNGGDSGGGSSSTCYHTITTTYAATNNYSCPSGYTLSATTCSQSSTYAATYTPATIYYYGFSG